MTGRSIPARFSRNALSNYVLAAVSLIVAAGTTPLLAHRLGLTRFGVWVLIGSLISYLELMELGIAGTTVSYIARHVAAGDEDDLLQKTVNTSLVLLGVLGALALLGSLVVAFFLPALIHVHGSLADSARWLFVLFGIDMCLSIPMDTFGGGLIALQRYEVLNATLAVVALLQAASWVVVLLNGGGLVMLGVVTVVISIAGQLSRYVMLRRLLPSLRISPRHFDRGLVRSMSRLSAWNAIRGVIGSFLDDLNVVVLSVVRNVATAGIYSVGERLAFMGSKVASPMADLFFPHAATLVGQGDTKGLAATTGTGTRVVIAATAPLCLAVAVLARPALDVWVGSSFNAAVPAVVLMAITTTVASLTVVSKNVLSGAGQPRLPALAVLGEAVVDIGATVVLGRLYGVTGVAVASLLAVLLTQVAVALPITCRAIGLRSRDLLLPALRSHLPPIGLAGTAGWSLCRWWVQPYVAGHGRAAGAGVVVAAGLSILVTYGAVLFLSGLNRAEQRRVVAVVGGWRR